MMYRMICWLRVLVSAAATSSSALTISGGKRTDVGFTDTSGYPVTHQYMYVVATVPVRRPPIANGHAE